MTKQTTIVVTVYGLTPYHMCPKIWTRPFYCLLMCLNITGWVANRADLNLTACSVGSDLHLYCFFRSDWATWTLAPAKRGTNTILYYLSQRMTKPTKWHVRPVKTQISLGIHPFWSESSLCTQWVAKDPIFLHADSEDSDQTGQMPRQFSLWKHMLWVFVKIAS